MLVYFYINNSVVAGYLNAEEWGASSAFFGVALCFDFVSVGAVTPRPLCTGTWYVVEQQKYVLSRAISQTWDSDLYVGCICTCSICVPGARGSQMNAYSCEEPGGCCVPNPGLPQKQ